MPAKNKTYLRDIGEFNLIAEIPQWVKSQSVIKGIGDDCAVFEAPKGKVMLFTTDMLAEGVHFRRSMGAKKIGYKSMACSISDIAAMGGRPLVAVVSLGVLSDLNVQFIQELYRGMNVVAKNFYFNIVGGDTIKTQKIIINVAMVGYAARESVVYRFGATRGDYIFTTGPLGRSLKSGKHLSFTPRLKESQYLVRHFKPTSMIDISDGLTSDLGHILEESKVGAVIYEKLIPKAKGTSTNEALSDGEDFELLFTVSPYEGRKLLTEKQKFPFYYIGDIVHKNEGFVLFTEKRERKPVARKGFQHF